MRHPTDPPLLLLHGFTGSCETWSDLRGRLSERRPIIAIDLPGHGSAGAPADPAQYSLDRVADELARLLDVQRAERGVVLGYSMGGRAALRFALRHPDRLAALVLESTSPGMADVLERQARFRSDAERADRIERDGVEAFVSEWERLPLWASHAALPDDVRDRLRAQRLAGDARGFANSLRGAGAAVDEPVLGRLGAIVVPVLLIAGALDAAYIAHAKQMAAALPEGRLAIVPGAGHAVHLERPVDFASLVTGFLDTFC